MAIPHVSKDDPLSPEWGNAVADTVNEMILLGQGGAINLDNLTDTTITSPLVGHVIRYNGTQWVNVLGTSVFDAAGAATTAAASAQAAAIAASQPVDSDLTAIAALSTTSFGRSILALVDSAALTASLSVATTIASGIIEVATTAEATAGTDTTRAVTPAGLAAAIAAGGGGGGSSQPLDSDLTAIAALTTTTYGRALLTVADATALTVLLNAATTSASGIVELATNTEATTGTDTVRAVTPAGVAAVIATLSTVYQPKDTDLTAIAALASAADQLPYSTGTGTWALAHFTAAGRALVDDATVADQKVTLGLDDTSIDSKTRGTIGTALLAGANMAITDNLDGTYTLTAGTASTYTSENARDDIAAALVPEAGYLTVSHGTNPGDSINISIDQQFKDQVARLSGLAQANDTFNQSASSVRFPGTAGAYASATHQVGQIATGSLTITIRLSLDDWTPATVMAPFGKDGGSGNVGFHVNITTAGFIALVHSVDGTATSTATATTATNVADGTMIWIKIFRDSTDGTTDFLWAADSDAEPTVWTTLTNNRATTLGNTFASTGTPTAGAGNSSGLSVMTGNVKRAIVRYAGVVTIDFDPTRWVSGTSWTSVTGATWTLQGAATIGGGTSNTISNSTTQFNASSTNANTAISLTTHDSLMYYTTFGIVNTSGSNVTYLFDVQVNGSTIFTLPSQSIPSTAAGQVRMGSFSMRADIASSTGNAMWASMELVIANNATGTESGAAAATTDFVRLTTSFYSTAHTAFTSVPTIALRCTMGTASSSASLTRGLTQLFAAKA